MDTKYMLEVIDCVLEALEGIERDINKLSKKDIINVLRYEINDYKLLKGLYLSYETKEEELKKKS